ncbi:MAG TPA: response regulator [Syntrophorhabdaceae bacterium]|jgi:FixJ family two-component response regulator
MIKEQSIVYVIDDDPSVRRGFERLLRSAGLTVETYSSVDDFFKGSRNDENACILMDVRLSGATGFDLQQGLAERGKQIPVIVVSASDDALLRERARELGAVSFFRKPIDDQALLDAIWWAISGAKEGSLKR